MSFVLSVCKRLFLIGLKNVMSKLKYFPFGQEFDLRMGTAVFTDKDRLIETDEHYIKEIAAKRNLLAENHAYYYRANENTELAQWDVVDKILTDLSLFEPENFILKKDGNNWHWHNKKLNESVDFVFGDKTTLPLEPLDWVGGQVQEDLVILSNNDKAALVAGQLCFANGWCLNDKFDQPFLTIHAPAPAMVAPTMQSAQKLMERILVSKPVWRSSWNFKIWNHLDLSSKYNIAYNEALNLIAPGLHAGNIGDALYIRIERQTLTRLPRSNNILFGIHMYQNTLNDEQLTKEQATRMLNVIRTTPTEMLNYKAVSPFKNALVKYLENIIG